MADERITMAHGAGGKMSQELMQEVILPEFSNPYLNELHDGATVAMSGKVAFTTDSYVVQPLFFNGGNIGKLAICGTVNDLSMTGAVPRYISVGMILEEGFLIEDLRKIAHTMREMADEAGIAIVTGDTKVVERGKADGIFINTAGIGDIIPGTSISPHHVKPGMKVLLSGFIGDHAATVLAGRHGLELPDTIKTDCAPLNSLTRAMLEAAPDIAVLRDPTRGGVAATLNEIAQQSGVGIVLDEAVIPVRPAVAAACELLGLDPLNIANEGRVLVFCPAADAARALAALQAHPLGREAALIGEVITDPRHFVQMRTRFGGRRIIDWLAGDALPRIC